MSCVIFSQRSPKYFTNLNLNYWKPKNLSPVYTGTLLSCSHFHLTAEEKRGASQSKRALEVIVHHSLQLSFLILNRTCSSALHLFLSNSGWKKGSSEEGRRRSCGTHAILCFFIIIYSMLYQHMLVSLRISLTCL